MELPLPSASLYLEITIYINIYIYIFIYIVKFVYSILFKGWGAIFIVIIVTIVTTVTAGGWSSKMRLFVLIVKNLSECRMGHRARVYIEPEHLFEIYAESTLSGFVCVYFWCVFLKKTLGQSTDKTRNSFLKNCKKKLSNRLLPKVFALCKKNSYLC